MRSILLILFLTVALFAADKKLEGEISVRSATEDTMHYDYYFGEEGSIAFKNGLELSSKGTVERQDDVHYKAVFNSLIIPYGYAKYVYDEEIETEAYRIAFTYPLYPIFKIGIEYNKEITFDEAEEFSFLMIIDTKYFDYSFYWFKNVRRYEFDLGPEITLYSNKKIKLIEKLKIYYYNDDDNNKKWWLRTVTSVEF